MDKYDELLARLDNLIRTHEGKLIDCHDAAAAIRELEAKLEAVEQRLREVEASTIERCAKVCEKRAYERFGEFGTTEHDTGATYYEGKAGEIYESMDEEDDDCAKAIRALAPERAVAEQVTECCDARIPEDQRYCPKCGWEARVRAPASPLLPGLERAEQILKAGGWGQPPAVIRAEISRLKGEGSEHE